MGEFTATQGRYLSFIHTYTEGFGLPPAESEIAEYLQVSPPSANQIVKTLETKGADRTAAGRAPIDQDLYRSRLNSGMDREANLQNRANVDALSVSPTGCSGGR